MICRKDYEGVTYAIWDDFDQVEPEAIEAIYHGGLGLDAITPLKLGKKVAFKDMALFQPKTTELLVNYSGEFFVICGLRPELHWKRKVYQAGLSLALELDGHIVFIGCQNYDKKPELNLDRDTSDALPVDISKAYYTDLIDGLVYPSKPFTPAGGEQLPTPTHLGWDFTELFLASLKADKGTYRQQLIDRFELEADSRGNCYDVREFIRYAPEGYDNPKLGDRIILDSKTRTLFLIHDGDVGNMCYLDNPVEAIDNYCAHILSRQSHRFDFTTYAVKRVF